MSTETSTPVATEAGRVLTRTKIGVVTSDKRQKTRTVTVEFQVKHPKYGKYMRRRTKYHVHDENNTSKLGDRVEISNIRPVSKTKSWRLVKVLEASAAPLEHKTEL